MAKDKVEFVLSWEPPRSSKEVQAFLGFAYFYTRFNMDFSRTVRPLTVSTKGKEKEWKWTVEMELAFDELKLRFTTARILADFNLAHFNPELPLTVETDAPHFPLEPVMSQTGTESKLHPIAFHSRKPGPAQMNYEIQDNQLLAVMDTSNTGGTTSREQQIRSRCGATLRTLST